ncbi:MAG: redoxin family protein [bacterium]
MRRGLRWTVIALAGAIGLAGCAPSGGGGDDEPPPGGEGEGEVEVPAEISEGLTSIRVTMRPAYDLVVGLTREFRAEGRYEDDSTRDVSAYATWQSSDPAILSFDDAAQPNIAMVHAARTGALTVTARLGEISGEMTIGGGCEYPRTTGTIGVGSTMPPLEWDLAVRPDGSRGTFSLRDAWCGEAEAPEIYVFVLGALWCGACVHEMALLAEEAEALRAAGGQFIFVAVEDQSYAPATTDQAMAQIGRLAGPYPVYVGGDADVGAAFGASGAFSALPSLVVVRARDMKVIADTRSGAAGLDFEEVARDPDAGWENPPPPQIQSNCEPGREEASEPNNTPAEAARIGAGTHVGGVCDAFADFYLIDIAGPWRATIDFEHAVGNLDLYAWDATGDAPLRVDQRVVGSYGVEDGETIEHHGPTIVRIGGFRYESAPYTLTVEAL